MLAVFNSVKVQVIIYNGETLRLCLLANAFKSFRDSQILATQRLVITKNRLTKPAAARYLNVVTPAISTVDTLEEKSHAFGGRGGEKYSLCEVALCAEQTSRSMSLAMSLDRTTKHHSSSCFLTYLDNERRECEVV